MSTQLHFFSDASEYGYGSCCYLQFEDKAGKVHTSLVLAKSRVAPLKHPPGQDTSQVHGSVPRLELTAAVVSTELDRFLQHELELKIDCRIFWVDITCTLRQI